MIQLDSRQFGLSTPVDSPPCELYILSALLQYSPVGKRDICDFSVPEDWLGMKMCYWFCVFTQTWTDLVRQRDFREAMRPWNSWATKCPITFGLNKERGHTHSAVVTTPFSWLDPEPLIKAESLNFERRRYSISAPVEGRDIIARTVIMEMIFRAIDIKNYHHKRNNDWTFKFKSWFLLLSESWNQSAS